MTPPHHHGVGGGGPPHGVLLAAVVVIVVGLPLLVGDKGEVLTDAASELLGPVLLLLAPIALLLAIQLISSHRGGSFFAGLFSFGEPDSIHRVSGSPVGVALFLLLLLLLLYNRVSIFGSDDDA